MMKKTMIAMAVAGVVAAPIAAADVSVGGKVEQGFSMVDSTTAASDQLQGYDDVILTFKASEDLGNGMTAFAEQRIDFESGAIGLNDYKVGISSDNGTLVAGRMEAPSEGKVMSMVDVFGGPESVEPAQNSAERNDNGLAYISPSFSGLTVAVAGYAVDSGTTTDDDAFDAQELALMYTNGPLTINVAKTDLNAELQNDLGDGDATSAGIKYVMGDLSLSAVYQDVEDVDSTAADDRTSWGAAAVYNMGNNSVALGTKEDELDNGTTDDNVTVVELRHKFSGRTRAYVGASFDDYATTGNETDAVYLGMEHKF